MKLSGDKEKLKEKSSQENGKVYQTCQRLYCNKERNENYYVESGINNEADKCKE